MDVRDDTHTIHSFYAAGWEKYYCHLPGSEENFLIYQARQLCDDKQSPSVMVNFKLIVRCFLKFFVECSRGFAKKETKFHSISIREINFDYLFNSIHLSKFMIVSFFEAYF